MVKIAKFLGPPTNLPKEAQWFTLNAAEGAKVDWNVFLAHRVAEMGEEDPLGAYAIDLVKALVTYDVSERLSTQQVLEHPFLTHTFNDPAVE